MKFVGVRMETARAFHGMTLRTLGERVVASAGLLSLYETEQREPSDEMVRALSEALDVAPRFFYEPMGDVWLEDQCSFRHRRTTQEKVKRRARAHGTLIGLVLSHLSNELRFPAYNVPSIRVASFDDIDSAMDECRRHWRLGLDTPILQIGRVLEHAGVVIVQHLEHSEKIDAFSRRGAPSVVVLNTARLNASRWIYDLAHELAHFVLHEGMPTGDKLTEDQAEYAGGAFMLPRRAFLREFRRPPSSMGQFWSYVFSLKQRWRVSGQAIVRRAYQLGLIGAVTYRQAYKYSSAAGWKSGRVPEPHEPEFAGPELLPAAFQKLEQGLGITIDSVCRELHLTPELLYQLTGVQAQKRMPTLGPRLLKISG